MKKVVIIILSAFLLQSCVKFDDDVSRTLENLTDLYFRKYVYAMDKYLYAMEYSYDDVAVTLDTIHYECLFKGIEESGDTVDVVSDYWRFGDSVKITVDGYVYGRDLWSHIYTVDDSNTLLYVDFYLCGNDSPWAWGECKKFTQRDKYVESHYDYPDRITTGYY